MGLLDSILGGGGIGLFGSNYVSPLFAPQEVLQPQYDVMGNYTGITPQAQSPFPLPQSAMPTPGQYQPPTAFNGGAPASAFQQFAGVPVGPTQQAPATPAAPQAPTPEDGPSGYMKVGDYNMPQFGPRELYQPQQAQLPPNASPTQGQMPQQQQVSLPPALGGGQQSNGFIRALQSIGNGGGLVSALTGNYNDPVSIQRANLKAQFDAYQAAGLSPAKAMIAVMNPKIAEQIMTPKFEKVGPGETLVSVGGSGGQGQTVATGGPEKPPAGYEYVDPKDPSKGLKGIAGGPATHLPAETAGRLAIMEAASADLPNARKVLMEGRGPQGTGLSGTVASYSNVGETGRAQRTVRAAIEGALRAMTGANAPEPEVKRYENMFMPSPFDSPETAKQKLDLLDSFISNARRMVTQGRGPAATPAQSNLPGGWSVSVR